MPARGASRRRRSPAGRWDIAPYLGGRPAGELPDVVSGASPAYDVQARGGVVRSIEITPIARMTRTLAPGHADVRALVDVMAAAHPAWRGGIDPAAAFVAISDAWVPVAGGALVVAGGGETRASRLCVVPGRRGEYLGATLLDALEAVARERGSARLRLDASALRLGDELPHARCGFTLGPPDAGDAEPWIEKDLRADPPLHPGP